MTAIPRPEYPRPQFVRDDWMNLNGVWQFEFDFGVSGEERALYNNEKFDKEIIVPFSPESELSGIGYKDFINGCWYMKEVEIPEEWQDGRVLLHFGAVDFACKVWVNGIECGKHEGGYISFTVDITRALKPGMNRISVGVKDDVRSGKQPGGKQSTKYFSHGCSYTRTTGIWQTVWLEHVPEVYMEKLFLTPDLENKGLHIRAVLNKYAEGEIFKAEASYEGKEMGECECKAFGKEVRAFLPLSEIVLWEVGNGRLYDLNMKLGADEVKSYFGMRSISLKDGSFCLNGKPVFQRTVLDQGFNPQGIITAPTDEHLRHDIEMSMAAGFNGARLHQKIFEQRFLYWADKLGYIVWGENGNWGLDVSNGEGLLHFLPEWLEEVERDYSSPALIGWCPFNETQPDTDPRVLAATYQATKALDPTRPCIDTSGWVHCDSTDVYDYHDYDQNPEQLKKNVEAYADVSEGKLFAKMASTYARNCPQTVSKGQPVFVSEYGGIGWRIGQTPGNSWGYGNNPTTGEEFMKRLKGLTDAILQTEGIMGFCYTQLTDVEQEINGIYTYDRQEKFPTAEIAAIFSASAWNEK